MAEPRDEDYNPYKAQTEANTKPTWLHDEGTKNLDADLDGMADYAKNMGILRDNLNHHMNYLNLLGSLPMQAWAPGALPEGAYTAKLMVNNYNELQQYLSFMFQALNNIGSAAETIAVAYRGTDGWSAADLNSVNFAFGDSSKRPSGFPQAWMDQVKTWQDQYSENMRTGNGAASGVIVSWTDQGTYTDASGAVHHVAMSSDGVKRDVIVTTDPVGGATVTTTTVTYPPNPNGRTKEEKAGYTTSTRQTKSSNLTGPNSYDEHTVNYGADGKETGSSVVSTTFGTNGQVTSTTTHNYGADGKETSGSSTVTNPDGTQTVTTTKNGKPDRVIQFGQQTEGIVGIGDQPAQDALNRLRPQ